MQNYRPTWKELRILLIITVASGSGLLWLYSETHQPVVSCLGCSCRFYCPPTEKIAVYSLHVNSPTNVTVTYINQGQTTVALVEYFVKDVNGNQYSNTTLNWSGPTILPGATASTNIVLNGQLTGQPFQIQTGHTYVITVVTARNNPFPYTFTA